MANFRHVQTHMFDSMSWVFSQPINEQNMQPCPNGLEALGDRQSQGAESWSCSGGELI